MKETAERLECEWLAYSEKYNSLKEYAINYDTYSFDIPFIDFIQYENHVFLNYKIAKPELPIYYVTVLYVTPAGKNRYCNRYQFDYKDILRILSDIEQRTYEKVNMSKINALQKEKKLEKLEKEIIEQRIILKKQQEEFLQATKDHIYARYVTENKNCNYENKTIVQKLKELKNELDNGVLTFEEYQRKRKGLM